MNVVLHYKVFERFMHAQSTLFPNETDNLINFIFQNEVAKLFLSKQLIDYCVGIVPTTMKWRVKDELMKRLFSNKTFTLATNAADLTAQFLEVAANTTLPILIPITMTDFIVENENVSIKNPKIAVIDAVQKPNIHWQRINLAAFNTFNVRYLDFLTQIDINSFFNTVFSATTIQKVLVFDRHFQNIGKHKVFGYLEKQNIPMEFYTLKLQDKNLTAQQDNDMRLAASINPSFYTTDIDDLTHERMVAFEGFLIETNDDFAQLKPTRETWRVDITYSPTLYANLVNKIGNFTKHNL